MSPARLVQPTGGGGGTNAARSPEGLHAAHHTAESSSAAQPTPRVPSLCVPGLLRVCPFEGSGEYSVSCSMAPPERPGQRPVMRIPAQSGVRVGRGVDYDRQPPPFALWVMRRGAIDRHFTGISVAFLRYVGRISGALAWREIAVIGGVGGRRGPRAVYKPRPMGMNHIYGEFLEDGI